MSQRNNQSGRERGGRELNRKSVPGFLACALAALLCGACGDEMPSEDFAESEFAYESWSGVLEANVNGSWKGVSCAGGNPTVTGGSTRWNVSSDRVLKDESSGKKLRCPEGAVNKECTCGSSGERMHGTSNPNDDRSRGEVQLSLKVGAPIFADLDSGYKEVCLRVENGRLIQRSTDQGYSCNKFRLRKSSSSSEPSDSEPSGSGNCHDGRSQKNWCDNNCKCKDGDGDCDSNSACKDGLVCREEGDIDRCR